MTPAERAARVDECERLVPLVCVYCRHRHPQVEYENQYSNGRQLGHEDSHRADPIPCHASPIHKRLSELAALKGETDELGRAAEQKGE